MPRAPKPPSLASLAARITEHLVRLEMDYTVTRRERLRLHQARAYASGSRVMVTYVSYQGWSSLTRDEATAYVAWLDAGNVGKHYRAIEEAKSACV